MPIILENSHAHSFEFTDEAGNLRQVTAKRGQDIEPLNIPRKVLAKLLAEQVISFNGKSRVNRYRYTVEEEGPDGTYTTGTVTADMMRLGVRENAPVRTDEEMRQIREEAEAAEYAANAAHREEVERAEAAREQSERDAADARDRAAKAEAKIAEMEAALAAQPAIADPAPVAEVKRGPGRPKANK